MHAASQHVDEVLCVILRVFPHKEYFGATLDQRLRMLAQSGSAAPLSIAVSEQGLFLDIARECREYYDAATKLYFLCGTDAAERILHWDYGRPGVVDEMLSEFEILVAARGARFEAPAEYQDRVKPLDLRGDLHHVSSTEVRQRIKTGLPWEHLVPPEIVDRVREIYS